MPEYAIRIHHRLVKMHPFVNGNGRHLGLTADLIMLCTGHNLFTWGGHQSIEVEGKTRNKYLQALKKADAGNYEELIVFASAD